MVDKVTKQGWANIYASAATGDCERTKKTLRKEGWGEIFAPLYISVAAAVKRLEPIAAQLDARLEQLHLAKLELEDAERTPLANRVEARAELREWRAKASALKITYDESDAAATHLISLRQHFPALFGIQKMVGVNAGKWPPASHALPPDVVAELNFLGAPEFVPHPEFHLNRSPQEVAWASER